jgi:hypothetical protein
MEKWNEARNVPEHPYDRGVKDRSWCAVLVVELIEDVAASNPEFIHATYRYHDGLTDEEECERMATNLGLKKEPLHEARPLPIS